MDATIYDDIAPFHDNEVQQVIQDLLADQWFANMVNYLMPHVSWEDFCAQMSSFNTKYDFQKGIIYPLVTGIIKKTADSLTSSNWENLSKEKQHLFISNHRDIILDAGLLNILRFDHNFITTEIAIGDNLFVYPWIKNLVRLNKSFVVKRSVTGREVLLASKHMSEYIHYVITQKNESVWLAQREGRAKDSDDRTQESLLKMLSMGTSGMTFIESLKELNIMPLSLSYEYDPCDYLKAKEFQMKRDSAEYKKTQKDDLVNMQQGLLGYKGHIHFQFGECINQKLDDIAHQEPDKKMQVELVAQCIDKEIHKNYKIYPINYISYDMLNKGTQFSDKYTVEQVQAFNKYIDDQIEKIDIENKDYELLKNYFLVMYSNTLKNHLDAIS